METLNAKRCYEILGLKPGATLAQIREQRGKLAHQWHPDKETDPQRKACLEDKMKDINNAFDFLKAALSGTRAGPSPASHGTPATPPTPAAKKPWEAEAEERRKRTAEREANERREEAARKREWKAEFQRVQAEAARQRAQQQAEAARLHTWLAGEKERQEQEGRARDQRRSAQIRPEATPIPSVRPDAHVLPRQREPRPPARQEAGKSKHIYLHGNCTKCGRSKEQIASYDLPCL